MLYNIGSEATSKITENTHGFIYLVKKKGGINKKWKNYQRKYICSHIINQIKYKWSQYNN